MITKEFKDQGKRENQEDSIGSIENTAYIVCDGVGGHSKGEVASGTTLEYMLQEIKKDASFSKESIQNLIHHAQLHLNQQLVQMPTAEGMGTTLASLFISKEAFYIAHIGDSRVYWVKPQEKKIWHTWDHSLVGNLMQMGQITREDGRFHPNGNRISKAIIANSDNKTQKADIAKITNVSVGDLFLICSDGVTESWSEYELLDLLCDTTKSSEIKLALIKEKCAKESKDNNTAFLLEVDKESAINGIDNEEISWLTLYHFQKDFEDYQKNNEVIEITENDIVPSIAAEEVQNGVFVPNQESKTKEIKHENNSNKKFLLLMLSFIFIGVAGYFMFSMLNTDKSEKPKSQKTKYHNKENVTTKIEPNNDENERDEQTRTNVIVIDNKDSEQKKPLVLQISSLETIKNELNKKKTKEEKLAYLKTFLDDKNYINLKKDLQKVEQEIKKGEVEANENESKENSETIIKEMNSEFDKLKNGENKSNKAAFENFKNTIKSSKLNKENKAELENKIDEYIKILK